MGPLTRRWPLPFAALVAVAVITGSTPPSGGAETASSLTRQADSLRRSESAALLRLYAAEASLSRAQTDLDRLDERLTQLALAEQDARRRTEIVRRSLVASRERVAILLRELYVHDEPDPLSVILGATSLEEAMAGIEGLARATAQNEHLAAEAEQRARRLESLSAGLAARRASLSRARSAARTGADRLAAAVAGRRETIATLRRNRSLTAERLTSLETLAREAGQRSAAITTTSADGSTDASSRGPVEPAPTASSALADAQAPASPVGTRTLVVDAVAYHLSGTTASGLPVGVGVIAVDPSVIPLGTRMLIPGYGPAVAADVGTAVKGNIIDLWMPSTARALAWGRRTVTITVYG